MRVAKAKPPKPDPWATEFPTSEPPTNLQRAAWAEHALKHYSRNKTGKTSYDVVEDMASDLICDLLHLLRTKGHDPLNMLVRARGHLEAEERGDES